MLFVFEFKEANHFRYKLFAHVFHLAFDHFAHFIEVVTVVVKLGARNELLLLLLLLWMLLLLLLWLLFYDSFVFGRRLSDRGNIFYPNLKNNEILLYLSTKAMQWVGLVSFLT